MYRLIMVGIIRDFGAVRAKKCRLCGMRLISCLLLVCITACSKKKEMSPAQQAEGQGSGTATAIAGTSGSGSEMSANSVPAGPKPTTERFFKEQYSAFLQTKRGVVIADGDGAPEHLCGPAIGTAMVRLGTLANQAQATAKPEDCTSQGHYTYCTFAGQEPASFVFDADEVLVAVWIGSAVSRAKQLEPELGKPRECKRE